MRRLTSAVALTLLAGLLWSAQAQTSLSFTVAGNEVSQGIIIDDTRFGAAFIGLANGTLPGYSGFFAASINYTPAAPGAGVVNHIVGGHWALTVSRYGFHRGTVYGTFDPAGINEVRWNSPEVSPLALRADVLATLSITGGTQPRFEETSGSGSFTGVLDHSPLYDDNPRTISPKVGGVLTLNITTP